MSDLFLFTSNSEIANFADNNSPYVFKQDIESVITKLEEDSQSLIEWVNNNALRANPDKFHLLLSSSDENISINVDQYQIYNSQHEKLLGITIDNSMKYYRLCEKGSEKLRALARISNFMNMEQCRKIMKAFTASQFVYCPVVRMFHSRMLSN